MTPQERQLIDDLFDRLAKLESTPRDPEAMSAIMQGLRQAPNAVYALVQTALVQDEALKRAHDRIQELEGGTCRRTESIRRLPRFDARCDLRAEPAARLGAQGSVPNVRAPGVGGRPVWNSGEVVQQTQGGGQQGCGQHGQAPVTASPLTVSPTARQQAAVRWRRRIVPRNRSGGSGRRGRWFAAARQHPLDDGRRQPSAGLRRYRRRIRGGVEDRRPGDQSSSDLARDAGINDIGSSGSSRTGLFDSNDNDDSSRAGFFDSASNDDDRRS